MLKAEKREQDSVISNDLNTKRPASILGINRTNVRLVMLQIVVIGLIAYLSLAGVRAAYDLLSPSVNIFHDALVWFGFLVLSGLSLFIGATLMLIFISVVNYKTFKQIFK